MIISDKDALARVNSPTNLINRKKNNSAMNIFGLNTPSAASANHSASLPFYNPFTAPSPISTAPSPDDANGNKGGASKTDDIKNDDNKADDVTIDKLVDNNDAQIKLTLAHDKALELLNNSVAMLASKLDSVTASKLPSVISAAGKVVESIRKERSEAAKSDKVQDVHYHFYTPVQKKISDYEVLEVEPEYVPSAAQHG